jgi:hypothetical protein
MERKNNIVDAKLKVFKDFINKKESVAVNAYVMFRSMEGKQRALAAYEDGPITRLLNTIFCCKCRDYQKKKFYDKWLKVKSAYSPDIILWENLKIGKCNRFLRILLVSFIAAILIAGTFAIVIIAKNFQNNAEEYSPTIDCPSSTVS